MENTNSNLVIAFLSDCYQCQGLMPLVKTAHKYFENACVLMDASYKTLYYLGDENIQDKTWRECVNGHFSSETLADFVEENLLTDQLNVISPCFMPRMYEKGHAENLRRASVAVPYMDGTPCAWFTIFENVRSITNTDMELLSWFAKILAPYLELLSVKKVQPSGRIQNLLLDMLDNPDNTQSIEDNLLIFGWHLLRYNRILLVKSKTASMTQPIQEYLIRILKQQFSHLTDFIYNGYLVCIICSDKDSFRDDYLVTLNEALKRFNLFGGFSAPIKQLAHLSHHYRQVVNCLNLVETQDPQDHILFFEDHTINTMLLTASQYFDIGEYCHSFILTLEEYDEKHQTQYVETLRRYVFNTKNLNSAARELHIHRNTLTYRMEKIFSILNIENIDQKLLTDLYMSYLIYDVKQTHTHSPIPI